MVILNSPLTLFEPNCLAFASYRPQPQPHNRHHNITLLRSNIGTSLNHTKNYIEATKTIFMLKHTSDGGTPPRIFIPCLRGNKYRKVPLTILSQSLSFTRAVKIEYQCMKMSSMQQYRSHPSQNKTVWGKLDFPAPYFSCTTSYYTHYWEPPEVLTRWRRNL